MTEDDDGTVDLIIELRQQIADLERQVADLTRHNKELREAVAALLAPDKVESQMRKG